MRWGMDGEEILHTFYKKITYKKTKDSWRLPFNADRMRNIRAVNDLVDADSGEVVLEAGKKLTVRQARQLAEKGVKALKVAERGTLRSLPGRRYRRPEDRRNLSPRPATS